jgi:hypothetical protein
VRQIVRFTDLDSVDPNFGFYIRNYTLIHKVSYLVSTLRITEATYLIPASGLRYHGWRESQQRIYSPRSLELLTPMAHNKDGLIEILGGFFQGGRITDSSGMVDRSSLRALYVHIVEHIGFGHFP